MFLISICLPIHPTDTPFQSWMKSDSLSTQDIRIASPAMFDFGCPSVDDAKKVFDRATRLLGIVARRRRLIPDLQRIAEK